MRGMGFSRSIWGISHTFSGNGCWYLLVGDSCGIRMRKYYRGVQKWLIIVVTHHGLFRIVYLLTIRGNMSNDDGIGITKMQSEIWSYPGIFSISFFHFLGIAHQISHSVKTIHLLWIYSEGGRCRGYFISDMMGSFFMVNEGT